MRDVLYVDACVNRRTSRTERLAQALLARLERECDARVETLVLEDAALAPLTGADVLRRTVGTQTGDFSGPLFAEARRLAVADEVVIAAPYWDFSFPAMLKVYLERLCAQGVTFCYSEAGVPTGLCRGRRVWYVSTAGGYLGECDYGFAQVKAIFTQYFGFAEACEVTAEGLDIAGNDADAIMDAACVEVRSLSLV